MKTHLITAGAMLLSLFLAQPSRADEKMPKLIRSIEGITEYRLENGLTVLLYPDVSKPVVTINLTVFVGSRHEGYGEAGMAHLLEHMVFKGTPTHQDIPKLLKDRGAGRNGTTWLDRTNYHETLPASDDNLEFAIRLEADRMVNSYIKAEDLESEMTVVRNEFENGENDPFRVLMQRMLATAYEWHNYGKSTIGNRADIERVPVDRLKRFYKKFYQPDNAMLVIAGSFDPEKALQLTQKYFGAIPRPERTLENTYTEEPAQDGDRLVTLRRVGKVPVAGLVYHIPSGAHPDFAAVDVLATILSADESGRLYKRLVKRQQAAGVMGYTFALHDPGVVMFASEANQGIDAGTLLDGMVDVVENVAEEPITEEEVRRAKQKLLNDRELRIRQTRDIAIDLSDWAAQGDWRLFFLYRDRVENVTVEDVQRVAESYFVRSNRTAGLFEPTKQPSRADVPPTPNLADMIGDYQGREQIAQGEAFDTDAMAIESRISREALSSGVKVALLPKKTLGESIQLRLVLRYGSVDTLKGQAPVAELLPSMLKKGTENLSRQDIDDALDQYSAKLRVSGKPGELVVTLKTIRGNLLPVMEVLEEVLKRPAFPEDQLTLLQQSWLAQAAQRIDSPMAIAANTVQKKISVYEPDDPRYIAGLAEEADRIRSVTPGALKSLYSSLLSGATGELTIVGDFDPQEVTPLIDTMLAGWKSEVPAEHIPAIPVANAKGDFQKINTPDKEQATYFAGLTFPMRNDHPDYAALTIGNQILGGGALSSRLGDRVRQNEGLSYGISSQVSASAVDERAVFYIYAITNPTNADRLKEIIDEEVARLLKDGITDEELQSQKYGFLESQKRVRSDDETLAQLMGRHLQTGRTMEFTAEFEKRISELTVEDVNKAMRKHIRPERLYIVMAGDFEKAAAGD